MLEPRSSSRSKPLPRDSNTDGGEATEKSLLLLDSDDDVPASAERSVMSKVSLSVLP